jgi:hypothetical protein
MDFVLNDMSDLLKVGYFPGKYLRLVNVFEGTNPK